MMRTVHTIITGVMGLALCLSWAKPARGEAAAPTTRPSLKQALADLHVPPAWFETTRLTWDTARPWKDGRIEIRRLLAGTPDEVRQAVKLTWLYAAKGDIGDGHELPMYLFMSGNYAWATVEYPKYLRKVAGKGAVHASLCYAACLAHFGEHAQAVEAAGQALKDLPPKPWRINAVASVHAHLGDLYAGLGQPEKAREHYAEAVKLYPTSDQPYGRHLLVRRAAMVQAKLDLLSMAGLGTVPLRDGTYTGKSLGYSDARDLAVTVVIGGGKITDVRVDHQEKIELNATRIIPAQIIAKQSLKVDVVTGATVTSQAIVDGALKALRQAGLK